MSDIKVYYDRVKACLRLVSNLRNQRGTDFNSVVVTTSARTLPKLSRTSEELFISE
jgi:hypothetical protein